jgi:hypothetical protein
MLRANRIIIQPSPMPNPRILIADGILFLKMFLTAAFKSELIIGVEVS